MKYVSFPWPPLEAAFSIVNASDFVKKQNFSEEINENKEECHQCRLVSFLNLPVLDN
jgi:hypothetical protein